MLSPLPVFSSKPFSILPPLPCLQEGALPSTHSLLPHHILGISKRKNLILMKFIVWKNGRVHSFIHVSLKMKYVEYNHLNLPLVLFYCFYSIVLDGLELNTSLAPNTEICQTISLVHV